MRGALRFLLPSAVGVFLFLTPVRVGDAWMIPLGALIEWANDVLADYLVGAVLVILTTSGLLSPWFTWKDAPRGSLRERFFVVSPIWVALRVFAMLLAWASLRERFFVVSPIWVALRVFAMLLAWATVTQSGPELLWSEKTGGTVLDLASSILMIFFFAAFLLPFLTDFGLMELLGTFLRKVFRRVFRLPGRSAIDAMASWLAAAAVGILITSQQYESGFYSRREASVIATNFSIVSIPFALLIANTIGIGHLFFPYYATVGVAGLVCAWAVPRLPPLKSIPDSYFEGVGKKISEDVPDDVSLFRWGWRQARERAEKAPGPKALARNSAANVLDIWFSLTPGVMAVGSLGLMIAEYTPLMRYLSYPLVPVLELLRIPEAAAAAPALLVGFLEMFLPAVIASGIESELTRFVVACMSIVQLIYMSEVGILLLKSPIPLRLRDLAGIFLVRTAVALPVVAAIAHFVVF